MNVNLVFMGGFTYPSGMAGTRRVQNVINGLKQFPDVSTRVILQRQSSEHNSLSGVHEGTPYETIMGDVLRARMLIALPVLHRRTVAALKRAFQPGRLNVIYFYGPLFLESIAPLKYARRLGYNIVFDVVEDFSLAGEVSHTFYHNLRGNLLYRFSSQIGNFSSGIVAISSYLAARCAELTQGKVPVHYMPISVDMDCFPEKPFRMDSSVSLFYAGSFGKKDGLPVLLDAFDLLAERYRNICLVLTGRGDRESMKEFFDRVELSPHKERIEYKGYLDDKAYYSLLNTIDIPCMTRVDLAFAHAGFPFKLGEYLATGRPVIASRVSDIDNFLVNKENAMLVEAGSSTEICQAVEFLFSNQEAAAAIGEGGRNVARSFFDYKRQGKALLNFLEGI